VCFAVWLLFQRSRSSFPPAHLLCQGFERAATWGLSAVPVDVSHGIPGVVAVVPNSHFKTLTGADWCFLLSVLGKRGCDYMMDLLLECAVFCPTELEPGNLYQLSGKRQLCSTPLLIRFRRTTVGIGVC
jgi:hypothetical protein